jgi:UDP-glucose 4-epimerase
MKILVTGGAGYIGSTTCSALLDNGHIPVILDSLICGKKEFTKDRIFYEGDYADEILVERIFNEHPDIKCVVHFAGFIYVPESVKKPYEYYHNNVAKSISFFKKLNDLGCKKIIFSSTASLFGAADGKMVTENLHVNPTSPYAKTKFMIENILEDYCIAYNMQGIALRYFNPIGADPQMRTGVYVKDHSQILSVLLSVMNNPKKTFQITGVNWPTRDGSGVRDYVHVWDLARAHVKAVENFKRVIEKSGTKTGFVKINLGTGSGVTVKELVRVFEKVIGRKIKKEEALPRLGDVAGAYASADTAFRLLDWKAIKTIEDGITDALAWREKYFSQ